MENASKALIIAGAILLSIIIISLGLVVVNNVRDNISGNNLSAEQKQAINVKFEAYEGSNITGMQVNNLIQEVIQYNTEAVREEKGAYVAIAFPTSTELSGNHYLSVRVNITTKSVNRVSHGDIKYVNDEFFYNKTTTTHDDETEYAARVATARTYKVTIKERRDGIVSHILVEPN